MVDPGDWLPIMGVALLGITTVASIVGAYAVGRTRRREREMPPSNTIETERIARIEQMIETMAEELERIGEAQRFLVKIMNDKPLPRTTEPAKSPVRVITPH